jgi:hypothetical protein
VQYSNHASNTGQGANLNHPGTLYEQPTDHHMRVHAPHHKRKNSNHKMEMMQNMRGIKMSRTMGPSTPQQNLMTPNND